MEIKNGMIGLITNFDNPHYQIILYSSDRDNQIGLEISAKYTFYYHERLADFTGVLVKFSISQETTKEIYFEVDCCDTGRRRKVSIKDLEKIERYYED